MNRREIITRAIFIDTTRAELHQAIDKVLADRDLTTAETLSVINQVMYEKIGGILRVVIQAEREEEVNHAD